MADRALVAVFGTENQAYDAARELQDLGERGVITVKNGAIVTKDDNGNMTVPDTKHVGTAWGLAAGTAIGALVGALLGPVGAAAGAAVGAAAAGAVVGAAGGALVGGTVELTDYALGEDFIEDVGRELEPGQTALLAEIEEGSTEPVDAVVTRYRGRVLRTELTN